MSEEIITKLKETILDRFSNLEPHQLEITKLIDAKFRAIMKQWEEQCKAEENSIITPEKSIAISHFFQRIVQVYSSMFNKFFDSMCDFRIENILKYELGGEMI